MAREPFKQTVAGIIFFGVISGVIANQLGLIDFRKWFNLQAPSNAAPSAPQPSNIPKEKPVDRPEPTSTNPVQQGGGNATAPNREHTFLDPYLMADWKTYQNTSANFKVLFPKEPEDKVISNDEFMQSRIVSVHNAGIGYMVLSVGFPGDQVNEEIRSNLIKEAISKILAGDKCQIVSQGPPSKALKGYNSLSYLIHCIDADHSKMILFSNVYFGKHNSYAVLVVCPAIMSEPAVAKGFLESFALMDDTR